MAPHRPIIVSLILITLLSGCVNFDRFHIHNNTNHEQVFNIRVSSSTKVFLNENYHLNAREPATILLHLSHGIYAVNVTVAGLNLERLIDINSSTPSFTVSLSERGIDIGVTVT